MAWTNTGKRAKPERKPELVIPEGGKVGQVLVKTPRGLEWADLPIPAGGNPGQVLMCTASGLEWADFPIAGISSYGTVKAANYVYDTEEDTQTNFENLIDAMKAAGMIDEVE